MISYSALTVKALYRDEEKLHSYHGPSASKSRVDVYSCSGKLIRRVNASFFSNVSID